MKAIAETLGQVLIALAGSDAHILSASVDAFNHEIDRASGHDISDARHMVLAAQKLWLCARTREAVKMPSSVAWRLALTALEEGLERYLELWHPATDVAEG